MERVPKSLPQILHCTVGGLDAIGGLVMEVGLVTGTRLLDGDLD